MAPFWLMQGGWGPFFSLLSCISKHNPLFWHSVWFCVQGEYIAKGECILLPVERLYLEAVRKQSLQLFTGERHCQASLRHGTKYLYLGSRLTSSKSESSRVVCTGFSRTPGQISWSADLSTTLEKIRLSGNERATLGLD